MNNTLSIENVQFPNGVPGTKEGLLAHIDDWSKKYQIIEVKSKLNTPLKNITIVAGTNWGKIIGEI